MRRITIVGAGQAGLQLGMGLLQQGYHTRIITDKTPESVAAGPILSTQCMFDSALATERQLGLNLWDKQCPAINQIQLTIASPEQPEEKALEWRGQLDNSAYSVDQRVKFPVWMTLFQQLGGQLDIHSPKIEDLEKYAQDSDLVIIASGKGALAQHFPLNPSESPFQQPQRRLTLFYVRDPHNEPSCNTVSFNMLPGMGEYFVLPVLTTTGPCRAVMFEAIPDSPMDCFDPKGSPHHQLAKAQGFVKQHIPWEYQRIQSVELTDSQAIRIGQFTPQMRHPVALLPSGQPVLGLGDAVCLNDPITGQGSNNAAKAANIYLKRILSRGDQPFDPAWMEETFNAFWQEGQWVTQWTNNMLLPPPPFILDLMAAATKHPSLANRIANGFNQPEDLRPLFSDELAVKKYLNQLPETDKTTSAVAKEA